MIYTPDLSAGITESFFQHIERLAPQSDTSVRIKKRLTEISIELLQNIHRHEMNTQASCLRIERTKTCFSIKAINTVREKDLELLTIKINLINKLNRAELKRAHTQALRKAARSEKGGAGLGLYRIALRSASQLIYTFQKINTDIYLFSLEIKLSYV